MTNTTRPAEEDGGTEPSGVSGELRQAFEAWALSKALPINRTNGHYDWYDVRLRWEGWQAAPGAAAAAPAPGDGVNAIGGGPADPVSAHETITKVIGELRAYTPEADEYMGRHILKGWAAQLESVAPPRIAESDAQYWLRHRSAILAAIEKRGFSLISSGGLFWLSEKAPTAARAAQAQGGAA